MNLRLLVALSGAIVIAGVAGCGTPDTAASTPSTSPEAAAPPCGNGMVTVAAEAPQAAVTHRGVTLTFGLAPEGGYMQRAYSSSIRSHDLQHGPDRQSEHQQRTGLAHVQEGQRRVPQRPDRVVRRRLIGRRPQEPRPDLPQSR